MTRTKHIGLLAMTALCLFVSSLADHVAGHKASAQDVQVTGPLAGAPACKHCRLYRENRFQLQPMVAFTLQDEFSRAIFFGAQAQYHITEWLGFGLWGGYAPVQINTGLTTQVQKEGQSTPQNRLSLPSKADFDKQIGRFQWAATAQATFIPLRGKLALFQKVFLDSDFYIFGGAGLVGVEERANVNTAAGDVICLTGGINSDQDCLDTQRARNSRVAFAPTMGVGLSLYAAKFVGITLEWRAIPFAWNTSGTDESGLDKNSVPGDGGFPDNTIDSQDQIFHFNHMFVAGVSFFLPTAVGLSE